MLITRLRSRRFSTRNEPEVTFAATLEQVIKQDQYVNDELLFKKVGFPSSRKKRNIGSPNEEASVRNNIVISDFQEWISEQRIILMLTDSFNVNILKGKVDESYKKLRSYSRKYGIVIYVDIYFDQFYDKSSNLKYYFRGLDMSMLFCLEINSFLITFSSNEGAVSMQSVQSNIESFLSSKH